MSGLAAEGSGHYDGLYSSSENQAFLFLLSPSQSSFWVFVFNQKHTITLLPSSGYKCGKIRGLENFLDLGYFGVRKGREGKISERKGLGSVLAGVPLGTLGCPCSL